jgi:hypothetical protein
LIKRQSKERYCWNVFIKIFKDFTSSFCGRLSSYNLDFCPALWRWPQTLVKLSPLWWVTKKQVKQWAPLNGIRLNQMYQSKITLLYLRLSYVSRSFAYCYQYFQPPTAKSGAMELLAWQMYHALKDLGDYNPNNFIFMWKNN